MDDVREVDNKRLEQLDERLFEIVAKAAEEGFSPMEVGFAFARGTFRLLAMEDEPIEGRATFVRIVGVGDCGCNLRIEVGDCPMPVEEEDYVTH